MGIGGALLRSFGYLFLLLSLPTFISLYVLLNSGFVSASLLQSISGLVSSFTHNQLMAGLFSSYVVNNALFVAGLIAIIGAAMIIFGSEGHGGLSKVGTEVLILSGLSLVSVVVIPGVLVPLIVSRIPAAASGVGSAISSLLSPITSGFFLIDIVFVTLGIAFIALRFVLDKIGKPRTVKVGRKNAAKTVIASGLFKKVGVPIGTLAMIGVLAFMTFSLTNGVISSAYYQTTSVAANSVSAQYQASSGTSQVFNLSNFYFVKAPDLNTSYKGAITLSPSFEPLPLSLPMSFSVAKLGDPIRFSLSIDLSQFSNLLSMFTPKNIHIPNTMNIFVLYNDSGVVGCTNLQAFSSNNSGLQCNYQLINGNLTKKLLNVTQENENQSILGQMLSVTTLPSSIFSGQNNTTQTTPNGFPKLNFVGHVSFKGNECSLFDVNGSYTASKTTGQLCISDSNGLPLFVKITENISMNGQSIIIGANFAESYLNQNITEQSINQLPPGAIFVNSSTGSP
jgi:hypothetical protein